MENHVGGTKCIVIKYGFNKINRDYEAKQSFIKEQGLFQAGHVFDLTETRDVVVNFIPSKVVRQTSVSLTLYDVKIEISKQHLPVAAMTSCCDEHDICYDTCNSDKEKCDFDFKRCLYKLCDQIETSAGETVVMACKTGAKMLFTGTLTLGCKSFMEAQKSACYCPVGNNNRNKKKSRYHTGGEL